MKTFSDKAFVKADFTRHCVFSEKEAPVNFTRQSFYMRVTPTNLLFTHDISVTTATVSSSAGSVLCAVIALCARQAVHCVQAVLTVFCLQALRQCAVRKQGRQSCTVSRQCTVCKQCRPVLPLPFFFTSR